MSEIVALLEACKAAGDYTRLAAAIPYTSFLGIAADHSTGELLAKMTFTPKLIGNPAIPALHGGSVGALLESAAIFRLLWEAETVSVPKTVNITIDYLRAGKPLDTFAAAEITKRGRRVTSVRALAWQESREKPIATASAHFLVVPRE